MNAQEAVTFLARQRREAGYRIRLRTCSIEEAKEMLARFATPEISCIRFQRGPQCRRPLARLEYS
jgi:hypothetical protein